MVTFMRGNQVVPLAPVFCLLATLYAQPLAAQEGPEQIVGQEFGSYDLDETGFIVQAYASVDPRNNHLFLTPFFAFEADKEGKLVALLDDPDTQGRRRITIHLRVYPRRQKEEIARRIQAHEKLLVPQGRFANVQTDDLITLGLRDLSITQVGNAPMFKPIRPSGPNEVSGEGLIELMADLPAADAKEFRDALSDGRRSVTFEVRASLNARRVQAAAILTVRRAEATDSEAYKTLIGNGTLFKAGVQGGVTVAPSTVMRNQRDRIAAVMRKELESKLIVDGAPKQIEWLKKQFDSFLEQAFKPEVIRMGFGQAAARLYAYDFKPGDLDPDQINKIVADVQDTFKQKKEEHEFKEAETSANVMFGVFGGTGNFRVKTDRLEKLMKDNGWRFELEGSVTVPRSLEVNIVDLQSFQVAGSFSGLLEEGERGYVVYRQPPFSTARRLDPSKPIVPEPWAEVAALRQMVNQLQQQGTSEAKRLTTVANSSLQYAVTEVVYNINTGVPLSPAAVTLDVGTWGSRVVAAWWEPIDAIPAINNLNRVNLSIINNNRVQVSLTKPSPGGAYIRLRYHILYLK